MTYYDTVIKDTPVSLWMLDGDAVDATGRGAAGTVTSGWISGAPLVDGPTRSFRSDSGVNSVSFPVLVAQNDQTGQPFSVECWFYSRSTTQRIMSNSGTNVDGIYMTPGGAIRFGINLSTGFVSVEWKPPFYSKHHAVGVYTGSSIELYVDGEQKAKYDFTDAEKAATFQLVAASTALGHNTGITMQAAAVYNYALPMQAIKRHWEAGNRAAGTDIATHLYDGTRLEVSTRRSNLLAQKFWNSDNWHLGFSDASIGEKLSSAVDDAGAYLASTWVDTFELAGSEFIDGVQLEWNGQGTFTVETSVDGATWVAATNGGRVTTIPEGFVTTNKVLHIRVTFTAGVYGEVSDISATGFKDRTVLSPLYLPVTRPVASKVFEPREVNLFDDRTELAITTSGAITIGPNTEEDALPIKSLGYWYFIPSGAITVAGFNPTLFYENGVVRASRTLTGHWVYVVWTDTAGTTEQVTITGTNLSLAGISIWTETLTAAQITDIFKSFTGYPTIKSSTVDSLGVITDLDASIYADDWSIAQAGV